MEMKRREMLACIKTTLVLWGKIGPKKKEE